MPFPVGDLTPNTLAGPPYRVHYQKPTQDDLRKQQNIQSTLLGGPGGVSTDWVNDFRNMHLNNNHWKRTQETQLTGPASTVPANGPPASHAVLHPLPPYATQFLDRPQFRDRYAVEPWLGPFQPRPGVQQTSAPQVPTMAPNEKQALDDVFAELFANADKAARAALDGEKTEADKAKANSVGAEVKDDLEFQEEMDQWMAVNGRSAEQQDQANEEMLVDAYIEQTWHRGVEDPQWMPQKPIDGETQYHRDLEDDYKLRKAAQDIMQTLSTNKSEKFQNSTFIGLMNRICQKEVVLQGNDLIDTTTGTVLGNMNDNAESEKKAQEIHDDPKGKGKAKEVPIIETQNAA